MTTLAYALPTYRLSWTRRIVGLVLCLVWVFVLAAYVAARIVGDNVFLTSHFGNLLTGIAVLFLLATLISFVLFPVRNSAVQRATPMVRFALIGVAALALVGAGLVHGFKIFTYNPSVVATSPDGMRRVALIDVGKYSELHIWVGTGVGTKDVANLGPPCEFDTVRFTSNSTFHVSTGLGDVDIRLDPTTGAPLNGLGHTCTV